MKKLVSHFMEKREEHHKAQAAALPHPPARRKTTLSRFMKKTLMPDEKFIADARFHSFYTFCAFLTFAFCALLGGAAQYGLHRYLGQWTILPAYIGLGVGVWLLFWMMLKKWTTEIILTDQRLLYKEGFFQIDVAEVGIEQLASDYVKQSLIGRILDYGRLHIRCIEATDIMLPDIARPYHFRNALEKEKKAFRENYMQVDHLRRSHKNKS